ncbi:DUF6950 family protein [Brevundimonas diminuta]|uniref:DUF6950 family protein n=1 Tax=Brevundimonas diminuta TaxID=293 RepID=UPI0030FC546E
MARLEVELGAFLERMTAERFVDGTSDCILTVADWIVLNGYPDPAEPYRGRYSTARERRRLIAEACGIHALMAGGAIRSGLKWTEQPQRGDVGLIRIGRRKIAAICLGERWATKGDGLVVAAADEVLMAWSI